MADKGTVAEAFRKKIEGIGDAAVRTLQELVEMGDSEAVRLGAAKTILDYIGVKPAVEVVVNQGELERVEDETATTIERLQRNLEGRTQHVLPKAPELETLMILESDAADEEIPVGGPRPGAANVIDV